MPGTFLSHLCWDSKRAEMRPKCANTPDYWLIGRQRELLPQSSLHISQTLSLLSCCFQSLLKHNLSPCYDKQPHTKKQEQHFLAICHCLCVFLQFHGSSQHFHMVKMTSYSEGERAVEGTCYQQRVELVPCDGTLLVNFHHCLSQALNVSGLVIII